MYVTEPVSDGLTRDCPQCKAKAGVRGRSPIKGDSPQEPLHTAARLRSICARYGGVRRGTDEYGATPTGIMPLPAIR